jgi:hypothetical protein
MAEVVQARTGARTNRQTSVTDHLVERALSGVLVDGSALPCDEHRVVASGAEAVPDRVAEITGQRVARAPIEPDHALTAELRVSDQDDSVVQIDIADGKPDGLSDAYPRDREQSDQGLHRRRTQRGEQLLSRPHKSPDVVGRVQIRDSSAASADSLAGCGHAYWQAGAGEIDC